MHPLPPKKRHTRHASPMERMRYYRNMASGPMIGPPLVVSPRCKIKLQEKIVSQMGIYKLNLDCIIVFPTIKSFKTRPTQYVWMPFCAKSFLKKVEHFVYIGRVRCSSLQVQCELVLSSHKKLFQVQKKNVLAY